jgi:hypothetical protein
VDVCLYAARTLLLLEVGNDRIDTSSHLCIQPHCENEEHFANESQEVNNLHDKCAAHQTGGCILACKCMNLCVPNDEGIFVGCHEHGLESGCWEEAVRRRKKAKEEEKNLLKGKTNFKEPTNHSV